MNIHKFVDNLSMGIAGKDVKKKYFSQNVSSRRVKDWIEIIKLEIPSIDAEGSYVFSFKRVLVKDKRDIQANLIGI